jgi:hypothetical protein
VSLLTDWGAEDIDHKNGTASLGRPPIALIPYYHRFSETDLFGLIFHTIVDKTIDKTIVNNSRENETKKVGFGEP